VIPELPKIENALEKKILAGNPNYQKDLELVLSFMHLESRPNRPVDDVIVPKNLDDFNRVRRRLPAEFYKPFNLLLEFVRFSPIRVEPDVEAINEWNNKEFIPGLVKTVSELLDNGENLWLIPTLMWVFSNLQRERIPSLRDWPRINIIAVPGARGYGRAVEAFRAYIYSEGRARLVMLGKSPYYDPENTGFDLSESEAGAAYLRLLGVPANRIYIESDSRNTRENVRFFAAILDQIKQKEPGRKQKVLLITSPYHLARYRLHVETMVEDEELNVEVFAMASRVSRYWAETYFFSDPKFGYTREEAMGHVFNEYVKIAYGICTEKHYE
jgi:uncharacterized SAM-binding protein YcdF (DUF218 family)